MHFGLAFGFGSRGFARAALEEFAGGRGRLEFAPGLLGSGMVAFGLRGVGVELFLRLVLGVRARPLLTAWVLLGLLLPAAAFGEGLREGGAVVLQTHVFDLFVDGLDVLVDLALVPEAFRDRLREQVVSCIPPQVYLTRRLALAPHWITLAHPHLHRSEMCR